MCQIPSGQQFNTFVMEEQRDQVRLDIRFAGSTLVSTFIPLLNCGKENSCHRYIIEYFKLSRLFFKLIIFLTSL